MDFVPSSLSLRKFNIILIGLYSKENLDESQENLLVAPLAIPIELHVSSMPETALGLFEFRMKQFGFFIETRAHLDKNHTVKIMKMPKILIKKLNNKSENDIMLLLNNLIDSQLKVFDFNCAINVFLKINDIFF